jgi:hypothetical protein
MKRNRGYEPIGIIIHIYMEMLQGNSLCIAIFILNKQKYHLFLFSSTKSENRKAEQFLPRGWGWGGGLVSVKVERWQAKGVGG